MEPDYSKMNAGEMLAALGDSAENWAAAFDQLVVRRGVSIDRDTMRAWFASAIVHGQDVVRWRQEGTE